MSEKHISEELWMRFLEGNVSEEESERLMRLISEDDALMEEYLSVNESLKRIDSRPLVKPDLDLAQKQIGEAFKAGDAQKENLVMLPRRSNIRKYIAMAAAAALLIGVALFFLFRPDHNDNNIAQQEKQRVETEAKTQYQSPEITTEPSQTNRTRKNDMPSKSDTEGVQPEPTAVQEEMYSSQKLEKHYAGTQNANTLTVTKPGKDSYRVLCKNLEKTLNFEWTAANVKSLHFLVKDSKGKTVAETKSVTDNHYSLKYSDIYPERNLTWSLVVVFKDGSQEKRNGQIQIDYNH